MLLSTAGQTETTREVNEKVLRRSASWRSARANLEILTLSLHFWVLWECFESGDRNHQERGRDDGDDEGPIQRLN